MFSFTNHILRYAVVCYLDRNIFEYVFFPKIKIYNFIYNVDKEKKRKRRDHCIKYGLSNNI